MSAPRLRPPAVAGRFYPDDPTTLRETIAACLAAAARPPQPRRAAPPALIVPHAGLRYSGTVAAGAYCRLDPAPQVSVELVVLLGPSHRVPIRGLGVSGAEAFGTPLGLVEVDTAATARACELPGVTINDAAHAPEHSLEVQLPFLQEVLGHFALLPVVVGEATPQEVAAVIDAFWDPPATLVMVSTDLSHYHSYDDALRLDARTAAAISGLEPDAIGDRDACGARPLRGLLTAARRRGLGVEQIDLRNSGDTFGDRDRVVGYGAFALA